MKVIAKFEKTDLADPQIQARISIDTEGDEAPGSNGHNTNLEVFMDHKVRLFPFISGFVTTSKEFSIGDDSETATELAIEWADSIADEIFKQYRKWQKVWASVIVPNKRVYTYTKQKRQMILVCKEE